MAKNKEIKFNIKSFIKGSDEEKDHKVGVSPSTEMVVVDDPKIISVKPTKKQPPAKQNVTNIIPQSSISYIQENIPYATAYNDTNQQLDEAINQLNMLGAETMADLQAIRGNKTLRNKYNYINDMTSNVANIINSKISAIKEKNNTINNINRMELQRMKDMKSTMNEEDDNVRIANMYDAFVNTPIGTGINPFGVPSIQDMTISGGNPAGLQTITIGNDQVSWEQSLDPAQNRMVLEAKGAIDTVVMYDASTGNRWYEVIDKQGNPVPNVEKPTNDFIYDLDLNVNQGFAKDPNRQVSYPLIVLNGTAETPIIAEY